jgi:phosphoglycerate dehydrogenase-like enzyme
MTVPHLVILGDPSSAKTARPGGLEDLNGRVTITETDPDNLARDLETADALLMWNFFSGALTEAWPAARKLRWIHLPAAGIDKLLFPELVASDVVVTNARGIFDRPIAEYVLAYVLAHAKQTAATLRRQQAHQWEHHETASITGAHALVVGTGAIGTEIGRLLRAVGLEVWGAARAARGPDAVFTHIINSADLAEHAAWVDYLVVASPLTDATYGVVNSAVFRALKPTAYLVNIARGACVDEQALLQALHEGSLAGAALDVFETEPLPLEHPFWSDEKVVVSPHMSGDVVGWRAALTRQFLDNMARWLDGRPLENVVDKGQGFAQL